MKQFITKANLMLSLQELESVLPSVSFRRILKDKLLVEGFKTLSEYARQNGLTKQALSKYIRNKMNYTTELNIDILRVGNIIYVRNHNFNSNERESDRKHEQKRNICCVSFSKYDYVTGGGKCSVCGKLTGI